MSDQTQTPIDETSALNATATLNESTKDRRDFLRNSVLAAGAVATLTAMDSATAQTIYDTKGNIIKGLPEPHVIDVTFDSSDIVLDDLYSVIKQLAGLTGCQGCGFNGYDMRFRINSVLKLESRLPVAATLIRRQGL